MILNEILNSDYRDLSERIDKHPDAVNTIGVCGESPAHIAIYKRDVKMLKMLLDAGTSPNIVNQAGDSLVHVTARLGFFECLQLLYETKRCELILKNKLNQTALDIAQSDVQKHSLHVLKLFAEYHYDEPSEAAQLEAAINGRRQCAAYLAEKMVLDREEKVRNMVQGTLDATNERRNKARILRGMGGAKFTSFYSDLTYHTNINEAPWEDVDMQFFTGYTEGLDTVVRTVFASDYAEKSVRVGMNNVLVEDKVKLPVFTYPVPTVEARIPASGLAAQPAKSNVSILDRGTDLTTHTNHHTTHSANTNTVNTTNSTQSENVLPGGSVRARLQALPNVRGTGHSEVTNSSHNASVNVGRAPQLSSLTQDGSFKAPVSIQANSNRRNLLGNRINSTSRRLNSISDQES